MSLKRDSANLLKVTGVVDYYDLDAAGDPTPVLGATVKAQVFKSDRSTQLGSDVVLTVETDQPQNDYRGIFPATDLLDTEDEVSVRYEVNAGGASAISVSWVDEEVVDA